MKYLNFNIIILFIFLTATLNGQEESARLTLSVSCGYGNYSMTDLKHLNTEIESELPFDVVYVNNFDPSYYFSTSLKLLIFSRLYLGLNFQFNSTGSRFGQNDYSGYYSFDQIINLKSAGLEPHLVVLKKERLFLALFTGIMVNFSDIHLEENFILWKDSQDYSMDLSSFSISTTPGIKIYTPPNSRFGITASFSRLIDPGGIIHLSGSKNAVLRIGSKKLKSDWSGWRLSLGLNWRIFRKREQQIQYPSFTKERIEF